MLKVYVQFSRYNKDQSLKSQSRKKLSRSFVKNFLMQLANHLSTGFGTNAMIDTLLTSQTNQFGGFEAWHSGGNADFSSNVDYIYLGYQTAARKGIIVGSGVGAVAMTDAYMGTIINNGTDSGYLEYLSCSVSDYTESDPNASFILERFLRNGSGDTVTINEVGVVIGDAYAYRTFMIIRDLVSPAETVADGEYLKITYTFQIEA